jgi:hypothetical protein
VLVSIRQARLFASAPLATLLLALVATAACSLATPGSASAQAWLADRSRAQGPGIRLGDFELHPGVGVEVGWDSNLYLTEDHPPPGSPVQHVDTGILRVTPHLLFSTTTAQRESEGEGSADTHSEPPVIDFQGGISAAYYEFFADPNRRNLALDIAFRLTVLPQRPFSFSVYDTFSRQIRPFTENINPGANVARDGNQAGLDLNFQTDGGVLRVMAGYRFGLDFFEDTAFQYGNSFNHTVTLQETYAFLPQTALVHDTTVSIRNYFNYTASAPVNLADSVAIRTRIGLNGAITTNVSLSGMIGYAAGFFSSPNASYDQDYDAPVGQLELRWTILEGTRLALGYDRDFQAAFLGNYYSRDRGYVSFQTMIGGVFLLGIDADVAYVDYGVIAPPQSPGSSPPICPGDPRCVGNLPSREDIRVGAGLFAEYRFTDWLGLNASLRYQGVFTDYQYNVMATPAAFLDPASYNKFEAFLGVRVFY